jgi:hypothetical protein
VAVALAALVPLEALVEQLIWYPLVGPQEYRSAGTPAPADLPSLVLWLAAVALPRLLIVGGAVRAWMDVPHRRVLVAATTFAALCQLQTLGRGDLSHLAQAAGPAIILLSAWLPVAGHPSAMGRVVFTSGAAILGIVSIFNMGWIWWPPASADSAIMQAARYVGEHTAATDPIYVGLTDNAVTWANPLIVYFLADRSPGSRYTMYNPGITNTERVQRIIVGELEATGTCVLVLDREHAGNPSPDASLIEPVARVLDGYIAQRFETAADYGEIVVMRRSDCSSP